MRRALAALQQALAPQVFDPRAAGNTVSFTLAMADATAALVVPQLSRRVLEEGIHVGLRVRAADHPRPAPSCWSRRRSTSRSGYFSNT